MVTAQRREEGAQDVPVSLSVVSESITKALGLSDTSSLQAAVPGLQFTRSLNSATPSLRGIGTNPNIQTGDEASIATYVDGVYIAAPSGAIFSFNNIKRIEVLKGPQGTLFGRNATGGVVQVITKDPEHTPGMNFEVGYANYDTVTANAYVTAGLSDAVAADLAVIYSDQSDGWGKNLTTGNDAFKEKSFGIRSKWLFTPGDNTRITLSGDYNFAKTDVGVATHAFPGSTLTDGVTTYDGFYNISGDFPGQYARTRQIGGSGKLEQDLGWANLVSITSYRDVKSFVLKDGDQTPNPVVEISVNARAETFTQEVQLLSPSESAIQWIVGAYYFHDVSQFNPIATEGLAFAAVGGRRSTFNKQRSSSYAGFGQVTAEILPATHLTLGARYTVDRRHQVGYRQTPLTGIFAQSDNRAKFPKATYKAALDHKFEEHILGYVSYSRGFKSGVYNLVAPGSPVVRPEVLDTFEAGFKTDLFDKRVRFNVAAYYNKFKNLQVSVLQGLTATLINAAATKSHGVDVELQVAPVRNFRITAAASYIDSTFSKFNNAQVTSPRPAANAVLPCTIPLDSPANPCNVKGNRTPRAPKWTANLNGQYTINRDEGDYTLSLGYYYNDGFYWEADNRIRNPSYHLLNGSVAWQAAGSGLSARLWIKNILSEKYYIYGASSSNGDEGSPAAPRTYGVTLGYRF